MTMDREVLEHLARTQQLCGQTVLYDAPASPTTNLGPFLSIVSVDTGPVYQGPWVITLDNEDIGPQFVTNGGWTALVEWGASGSAFRAVMDYRSTAFVVHGSYVRISGQGNMTPAQINAGMRRMLRAQATPGLTMAEAGGATRPATLTAVSTGIVAAAAISNPLVIPRWAVGFTVLQGANSVDAVCPSIARHLGPTGAVVAFTEQVSSISGAGMQQAIPTPLHPDARTITLQNIGAGNADFVVQWHLRIG